MIIILIVVTGFCINKYLDYKHLYRLEVLLKARDLYEAKRYEEQPREEIVEREQTLDDLPDDPEAVQEAFRQGLNG